VKFGLPEVLFNLFPGMGAYSFLSRRLDAARAERMILSGRLYTAEEMYEMGVVDVLAEPGCGVEAVHQFVERYGRTNLSRQAMAKARQIVAPVTRDELMRITDLWVDTALSLSASDLRKMRHLAKAQNRRWAKLTKHV
jgi:DSF synthase